MEKNGGRAVSSTRSIHVVLRTAMGMEWEIFQELQGKLNI